jgi:hypothetical protein
MSKHRTLVFKEIEPCIGLITLNRPDKLNAINVDMLDDFNDLFAVMTKDDAIRVLIITGQAGGFAPVQTSTRHLLTRIQRPCPIRRNISGWPRRGMQLLSLGFEKSPSL